MRRYIAKFIDSLFSNRENQNELFWQRKGGPIWNPRHWISQGTDSAPQDSSEEHPRTPICFLERVHGRHVFLRRSIPIVAVMRGWIPSSVSNSGAKIQQAEKRRELLVRDAWMSTSDNWRVPHNSGLSRVNISSFFPSLPRDSYIAANI